MTADPIAREPTLVEPSHHLTLDDYAGSGALMMKVQELRAVAATVTPRLDGRTVWMVNSTARGGGVAEMLPGILSLLRELNVDARWMVLESDDARFFEFTKQIHNLIHGEGDPRITEDDVARYESVNRDNAQALGPKLRPGDLLVVHDPQPAAMGATLGASMPIKTVWRSHIGLDKRNEATRAAWAFLEPYVTAYDHAVFSVPEYIPPYLTSRSTIIHPAIDPLNHKNRELSIHKLVGILFDAGLTVPGAPMVHPPFEHQARRLQPDGRWGAATSPDDIGLLFRPIVTQVSRWDRLKGWRPLMAGFVTLKRRLASGEALDPIFRRTIESVRLVLAGPDPDAVPDDPEQQEVLGELIADYRELPEALRRDIVLLALPMTSAKENALMVNALQRCSTVVAQNSLREGFGLTVTEALWKGVAVMGSCAAGIRQQIHDGLEGRLVRDPADAAEIAQVLGELLEQEHERERLGHAAQLRVLSGFLIFTQLRRWLEVLGQLA